MTRFIPLLAAAVLISAPAAAETYSAKPVNAPAAAKIIGKDISWSRDGDSYRGSTDTGRALVICQDLAKRAGKLESFAANGQPLAAADLDKCNAKAGATTALARAN